MAWYEQISAANFRRHIISNAEFRIQQIKLIDIDYDGDLDILSVSSETGIGLWKNIGWNGHFKTREMLDSSVIGGNSISVHVQANDVGGVDVGAFLIPINRNRDIYTKLVRIADTRLFCEG